MSQKALEQAQLQPSSTQHFGHCSERRRCWRVCRDHASTSTLSIALFCTWSLSLLSTRNEPHPGSHGSNTKDRAWSLHAKGRCEMRVSKSEWWRECECVGVALGEYIRLTNIARTVYHSVWTIGRPMNPTDRLARCKVRCRGATGTRPFTLHTGYAPCAPQALTSGFCVLLPEHLEHQTPRLLWHKRGGARGLTPRRPRRHQ